MTINNIIIRCLICCIVVFLLGCDKTALHDAIIDYSGCNLQKVDPESYAHFSELVDSKIPSDLILTGDKFWHVWNVDSLHSTIVFSVRSLGSVPGTAYVRIILFDYTGNYIMSSYFSTGNRMNVKSATMEETPFGTSLLKVNLTYNFTKNIIMHQYYGIINGRVALIRAEDNNGKLFKLNYSWGVPFGPKFPEYNFDDVAELLKSENTLELLELLVWLSGEYSEKYYNKKDNAVEHERSFFKRIHESPIVKKQLEKLSISDNKWMKEAASEALKNDGDLVLGVTR